VWGKPALTELRKSTWRRTKLKRESSASRVTLRRSTDLEEDQSLEVGGKRRGSLGNLVSDPNPTARWQPERDERIGTSTRGNSLNSPAPT